MVSTKDYLNLSALAYVDFEGVDKGKTIGSLADSIKDGTISRKEFDLDRPELSALKNKSNPLRSWKLLDFKNSGFSGFYAIALQNPDTKEIVFSFRGTNNIMNVDIFTDIGIGIFVPHFLHLQFVDAKNFVFDILNKYGSTHYDNQEGMLKALNQDSKVSFTGHSLGGGLAQYMTYVTSDMGSNDIGAKSVTFNGVGIGQNAWDIEIWGNGHRYNSTNHINSGDFTGNYGMGLGRPIYHVDALSGVRSQSVNVKALATMLMYKVYSLTGKNRKIDYLAKIKNIQKSLKDGDERRSTTLVYEGFFEGGGGSGVVRYHMLDTLIDRTTGKVTDTVEENAAGLANKLDEDKVQKLIGAIKVIEVAKERVTIESRYGLVNYLSINGKNIGQVDMKVCPVILQQKSMVNLSIAIQTLRLAMRTMF